MPIQRQDVTVNFGGTIDSKSDPFQVNAHNFLALNNVIFTVGGRMTKRNGFPSLGTSIVNAPTLSSQTYGSTISAGRKISAFNNELIINDGFNTFSYLADVNGWSYKGRDLLCDSTNTSVVRNGAEQSYSDSAISSTLGQTLFAYEDSVLGLGYSLVDTVTSQIIVNWNPVSATGSRPKVVAIGSFFYVIYFDSNDSKIHATQFTSSGKGADAVLISNNNTTTPNFDTLVIGSTLYVGYYAASTINISSFNSSLALQHSITQSDDAPNGLGIFSDTSNNIWIAYNTGSATRAYVASSVLVLVLTRTTIDSSSKALSVQNVTGVYDGTKGVIFYDQPKGPVIGPTFSQSFSTFTQPAVNSTASIDTASGPLDSYFIGAEIGLVNADASGVFNFIGYYEITAISSGTITIKNLGLYGSVAPGTVVTATSPPYGLLLTSVGGYSDATTNVNTLTVGGTVGTISTFQNSVALNSKAFLYNNVANVILIHDAELQPTYFMGSLYNYTPGSTFVAELSAKIFPSASGKIPLKSTIPNVNVVSSGIFQVALQQVDLIFSTPSQTFFNSGNFVTNPTSSFTEAGVSSAQIDFTTTNPNSLALGNNLLTGSGLVSAYDGAGNISTPEQNFNLYPENVIVNLYVVGGGLLGAGAYSWKIVYESTDNMGQVNQSNPSIPVSVNNGSDAIIYYLRIPTLRVTEKANVNIVVYRTTANGTVYYRVNNPNDPLSNSTTSNYVTFVDNVPDSQIIGNEQLYTTGEIEDLGPPGSVLLSSYKNRAILVPSEDSQEFWYSKQVQTNTPVEFNDTFVQNTGSFGGPITAISQMDDKLIIFKRGSILYMVGSGPAASGAGNDFTDPLPIAVDVGCVDRGSIVLTPSGLMFKSAKGIYLLDRSLQASYIGAPVEGYNQYNVVSAQLIPNTTQVRFLLSSGTLLMYDYYFGKWGTFSNPAGVSDCIFQSQHTYIASNGIVYKEAPGVYYDGTNTPVLMSFQTANLNMAAISGYERIYDFIFLANYLSAHQIQIQIGYNYQAASQSVVITPNSLAPYQWKIDTKQQLCQAFQITLTELYTGILGASFTMSGITYQLGIKKAVRPIRGANSAGLS